MKVFFASRLQRASASGRQRLWAMRALGHEVREFPIDGYEGPRTLARRLRDRVWQEPYEPKELEHFGRSLLAAVVECGPDLVWLEKPLMLRPSWLAEARRLLPNAQFVCFQDDDPFGSRRAERMSWRHFIDCIRLYDVHFVKRAANVSEFAEHGAKSSLLFMHGCYPPLFHPRSDHGSTPRHDVVFVGTALDHRVRAIAKLMAQRELGLHVHGANQGWRRTSVYWMNRDRFHAEIEGEPYARVLAASKIALGFVSSSNRDEYSMRTFEIPASGTLFLAERTPTHQALYKEGEEAEFFGSVDECADKCRFYLRHESLRQKIALRGYERCMQPDYSLVSRMQGALKQLEQLGRANHQLVGHP